MLKEKYTVYYRDKYGDLSHVWVEAYDEDDAADEVKHEYWDVKEIVEVRKW